MQRTRALAVGLVVLLASGTASAQGIALFGDARLGLAYNIDNDGGLIVEDGRTPDDWRAVSRIRFGVNMTGTTDSGITFGGTIRADNAPGGEGGTDGQREGDVFVSGAWGTVTYGDTNAADEQWVGDVPGDYSLTGLTELDETDFISNGGSFGDSDGKTFADNPFARPTVRYDFDWKGFGLSLSTNRDLTDIGVGGGYAGEIAGGSWSAGLGYYRFAAFDSETTSPTAVSVDVNGDGVADETIIVPVVSPLTIPAGEQWSAALKGEFKSFAFGVTYMTLNSQSATFGAAEADNLLVGVTWGHGPLSIGAIYGSVLNARGDLASLDGGDAYELSGQYDLGGGATVNGGIGRTYPQVGLDDDTAVIADFGISMSF
jgi:outer membrane protein OmpU